jgi:hypothetical protein
VNCRKFRARKILPEFRYKLTDWKWKTKNVLKRSKRIPVEAASGLIVVKTGKPLEC